MVTDGRRSHFSPPSGLSLSLVYRCQKFTVSNQHLTWGEYHSNNKSAGNLGSGRAIVSPKLDWSRAMSVFDMTTTHKHVVLARCTDSWDFGRLAVYDQLANCNCAEVAEERRKEISVEECAQ